MTEPIECLDDDQGGCSGPAEYRLSLTGTGTPIPRCDRHWGERLEKEDEIRVRYPDQRPADFDPLYAGERWDEDDPWP